MLRLTETDVAGAWSLAQDVQEGTGALLNRVQRNLSLLQEQRSKGPANLAELDIAWQIVVDGIELGWPNHLAVGFTEVGMVYRRCSSLSPVHYGEAAVACFKFACSLCTFSAEYVPLLLPDAYRSPVEPIEHRALLELGEAFVTRRIGDQNSNIISALACYARAMRLNQNWPGEENGMSMDSIAQFAQTAKIAAGSIRFLPFNVKASDLEIVSLLLKPFNLNAFDLETKAAGLGFDLCHRALLHYTPERDLNSWSEAVRYAVGYAEKLAQVVDACERASWQARSAILMDAVLGQAERLNAEEAAALHAFRGAQLERLADDLYDKERREYETVHVLAGSYGEIAERPLSSERREVIVGALEHLERSKEVYRSLPSLGFYDYGSLGTQMVYLYMDLRLWDKAIEAQAAITAEEREHMWYDMRAEFESSMGWAYSMLHRWPLAAEA